MLPRTARSAHLAGALATGIVLLVTGCVRGPDYPLPHDPPRAAETMVMSYNLRVYAYMDRDDDGQADDFKPEHEIDAIVKTVASIDPDVLAIQEIGRREDLDDFRERLRAAGAEYLHADYLGNDESFANLAVLSKLPISSSDPVTNLAYTIEGDAYPVRRGFQQVDLATDSGVTFTLMNVHLKSKRFHPAGQTEMRRNEARLLATHVRRLLKEDPERRIVICGDFNDSIRSSSMRELIPEEGGELTDLFLKDANGHVWTHYYSYRQQYSRIDYLIVSTNTLGRVVKDKSGVVQLPGLWPASDHRPVYATFTW